MGKSHCDSKVPALALASAATQLNLAQYVSLVSGWLLSNKTLTTGVCVFFVKPQLASELRAALPEEEGVVQAQDLHIANFCHAKL